MDSTRVVPGGFHMGNISSEDGTSKRIRTRHRCLVAPVKYYIIDFDLSTWFPDGGDGALVTGIIGQTKVTPELSDIIPYDPFKVDIIQLAAALTQLLDVCYLASAVVTLPFLTYMFL